MIAAMPMMCVIEASRVSAVISVPILKIRDCYPDWCGTRKALYGFA
jgi:hypothetical protein